MLETHCKGEAITHRVLWRITQEQVELAQGKEAGWIYPSVVAQVFAYHTVEAYLNYVGERLEPDIWRNERNYFRNEPYRGALGKMHKIVDLVGLPWTEEARDERPLKTIMDLKYFRDLISHGKTEKFDEVILHEAGEEPLRPSSELVKLSESKEKLSVVLEDVEQYLDSIHLLAKPMLKVSDTWFGSYALKGTTGYRDFTTGPRV